MKIKRIKASAMKKLIIAPSKDANKYTRGKLTIIGGSREYPGAACLAAGAALRCGAGYVEVACDPFSLPIIQGCNPNIVARDWRDFSCEHASLENVSAGRPKACLIGSGFSANDATQDMLLKDVLVGCAYPLVVDGGALGALSNFDGIQAAKHRRASGRMLVLTPHYGEAARLAQPLGIAPPDVPFKYIEQDANFASALSEAYGAVIVLKGSKTIIADAGIHGGGPIHEDVTVNGANAALDYSLSASETSSILKCYLMDKGPACLAKAGTGDVLAGMVSAFLAQGKEAVDACRLATFTHAKSAILAQEKLTSVCVCATDVIDALPRAFKSYEREA